MKPEIEHYLAKCREEYKTASNERRLQILEEVKRAKRGELCYECHEQLWKEEFDFFCSEICKKLWGGKNYNDTPSKEYKPIEYWKERFAAYGRGEVKN